ncbi:MAG: LysR family transcriptional regulator [Myxococcota bacterium]
MDKLAAMRGFIEVVDQGSLTAAGRALGKSLPTMVRTLAALEEDLGVRLLRRTTRRMSLTPEGHEYLARCRQILADIDEAERLLGESGELRGGIRITAPVLFGQMHVAPAAVAFAKAHQEVDVDLMLLDRVVDLVDEGIDVGIRIAHLADSAMIAIPVGTVRQVVVASPALLRDSGPLQTPRELRDRPTVRFDATNTRGVWRFREDGKTLRVEPRTGFRANHASAAIHACTEGLGFGRFLSYQVAPHLRSGTLERVLREFEDAPIPVQIIYPEARLMSARLRAFVDWMRDRLREREELDADRDS